MSKSNSNYSEWQTVNHALSYLSRADKLPHRTEGERVLIEQIPQNAQRFLDLGTGNGRTLGLVMLNRPSAEGIGLDFSETMLEQARKRFEKDTRIKIMKHDFSLTLPSAELGKFDAVVSSLAIHHLTHKRKRQLYTEVFGLLNPGGVFCNLDHVCSPSHRIHLRFLAQAGQTPETEDPSNKLLDFETQLQWFKQIGFTDIDCYWKWLEIALLIGFKN